MRSVATLAAFATAATALSYHSNDPSNHVVRRASGALTHHQLAQRAQAAHSEQVARRMHKKVRRQDASKLSTTSSSSSSDSKTYSTTAIWYAESGWVTSCGETLTEDAYVVGLPLELYPNVGEKSDLCGTEVVATNSATGANITATVIDASNRDDYTIFSPTAFTALGGDLDTGELAITFAFADGDVAVPSSASTSAAAAETTTSAAAAKKTPSAGGAGATAQDKKVASLGDDAVKVAAVSVTTTTTSQAPQTTEAPKTTTTTTSSVDYAASSSKAAAEAKASSEASYEAYQLWAASSTSAAAAASQSSADAAWASSSSAAAAASKSSADAAWASSSSSAAAAAAAETSKASSSSDSSSSSSGGGKVYSGGIATFFYQNGVAGNCGKVNSDSTLLVALPTNTYAGGSHCGKYVTITRTDTGDSIDALVADSVRLAFSRVSGGQSPTCENDSCLDLSWGAFSALGGTTSMGVFDITWSFN
ncbi:hypothetical protein JCM6882_003447 [Rhodosporidiobolus microsporus]